MLIVDSVYKDFSGNNILNGCYLQCQPGEVIGLLGRNGSGKSTLLKIIFGLTKASHQHIKIDNILVEKGYRNKQIAYLPQQNFLPHFLKIKEIIELYKLPETSLENFLESKNFLDLKVGALSSGQLRMFETFLILHHPAKYILLDEPFSQISPVNGEKIIDLINEKKKNKGIIITDHYYRNILSISDRIYLMKNGSCYAINSENDLIFHQYIPIKKN
jgi:lipopolysaccharide export system ATP-binding protein